MGLRSERLSLFIQRLQRRGLAAAPPKSIPGYWRIYLLDDPLYWALLPQLTEEYDEQVGEAQQRAVLRRFNLTVQGFKKGAKPSRPILRRVK